MKLLPIVICGPTAVGKSRLALALAQELEGEIISVDSRKLYKYMDIATAKPTEEERGIVPHHLIDLIEPDDEYSAGHFGEEARKAIAQVQRKGKTPLLVGGSGLYLKAVVDGLFCAVRLYHAKSYEQAEAAFGKIVKDLGNAIDIVHKAREYIKLCRQSL